MIFRWSIWGSHISKNIELLRYSVLSFQRHFGDSHQYVVYTDNTKYVSRYLNFNIELRQFPAQDTSIFNVSSKATWMKWCPAPRLDISQTELYIDSDVFLLKYPKEIDTFLADEHMEFAVMDEYLGQSWQHGSMARKTTENTPFINAGFFVQKAGHDITQSLIKEFNWWRENIKQEDQTHHDEQGALAIALTEPMLKGKLFVLPKGKYMLIGPNENKDVDNLDDVTMFHAVYPDHPAFYKFKDYLDISLK